jgi:2-dehydro-3-deoxyphosphogluconate aldolase/(4S)-4-hydroxy-2-oxoglutarate aldolase
MKKFDVLNQISSTGVVAVVRAESTEMGLKISEACIKGGVKSIEVTYTVPGAGDIIATLVKTYENDKDVMIGAGTVLDSETARDSILHGAKFIVSPCFDEEVAKLCNRYQVPYVPGTQTVREVKMALDFGSDVIKVFPGDILGPKFVKDVKGPLPYANLMPSGGVDINNIEDWIKAGVVAVSAGSSMTAGAKKGDYEAVADMARQFVEKVAEARANLKK